MASDTEKKRILFVLYSLAVGGTEKVMVNLINAIADQYHIEVLCMANKMDLALQLPESVPIHTLFPNRVISPLFILKVLFLSKSPKRIRRLMQKRLPQTYDFEIAFSDIGGVPEYVIHRNSKAFKMLWLHFDAAVYDHSAYGIIPYQKTLLAMDRVICVSNQVKRAIDARYPQSQDRTVVLHNLQMLEQIHQKADQSISLFEDTDVPNLVCCGRISSQKAFGRMLRVHARLMKKGLRHRVHIVGPGWSIHFMRLYAWLLGVRKTACFWGKQSNPYPFMKQADCFVLCSKYEGLSTVCIESLTLGTPVLATRVAGIEEIVQDGMNGCIVGNDERSLQDGMENLLRHPETLREYRENAKGYHWDNPTILHKFHSVLNEK